MRGTRETRAAGVLAMLWALLRAAPGAALLAALTALWVALPGASAEPCAPWPEEPAPLPTPNDPDLVRATWASLRIRELSALASQLEESDALRARQLWQRLLCIDPSNEAALAGLRRNPAVRVHRPPLRDRPPAVALPDDPWQGLSSPIGVRVDHSAERLLEARAQKLRALRAAVADARAQVRGARFDAALESAAALRRQLEEAAPSAAVTGLRVELAVLTATAELALGREAEAVASLRRALAEDPGLTLDPATTSPKVLRALERARSEARP